MKHKAYQLVDFNNPVSVEYHKRSIESFKCISDILDIEPIQCFTPDTIPSTFSLDGGSKPHFPRTKEEIACFASHTHLISRLAEGEKFIIMEHDAYLFQNRQELLRSFLLNIDSYHFFVPGIAAEFYTVHKEIAKSYMKDYKYSQVSAFSWLEYNLRHYQQTPHIFMQCMFPVRPDILSNKVGVGNNVTDINRWRSSDIVLFDSPITQLYIKKFGNTIPKEKYKFHPSPKDYPNDPVNRNFYYMEE